MNIFQKILFLITFFLSSLFVFSQNTDCSDLNLVETEFVITSDSTVELILTIHSNSLDIITGIASIAPIEELEFTGLNIIWDLVTFSVQPGDEITQLIVTGTTTSIITLPDDLEISGIIVIDFDEESVPPKDDDYLNLDTTIIVDVELEDTIATDPTGEGDSLTIIDIDIDQIDDTVEDNLILPDNELDEDSTIVLTDMESDEDSTIIENTTDELDMILAEEEITPVTGIQDKCMINYTCQVPVYNGEDATTEERIVVTENTVEKPRSPLNVGSIFEDVQSKKENNYFIYPNPAKDHITIFPESETDHIDVEILNAWGSIVYQKQTDNNLPVKITTNHLPTGLYFLTFKNNGKVTNLTKLILK